MHGVCAQVAETADTRILWALLKTGFSEGGAGLGAAVLGKLIKIAGSPQALWEVSPDFIRANLKPEKARAFEAARAEGLPDSLPEVYERAGIQVIPITDPLYPPMLKEIYNAPLLLFVKGDPGALVGKTIGMVGTRKMTDYGRQVTEKLVAELAPVHATMVSGLAAGIDSAAHWAALQHEVPTVAVFGCGLDTIFPANNDKLARSIVEAGGALVSEYPLGFPPSKFTFPQRNRIVAGLSYGTVVVEGDRKSGALITARIALEEGRSVYAVPGNIFASGMAGPLSLLKTGAIPVSEGADILKDLGWLEDGGSQLNLLGAAGAAGGAVAPPPPKEEDLSHLSQEERTLLKRIPYEAIGIDQLVKDSGKSASEVNELLTMLELEGLIRSLPGAKISRGVP